MGPGPARRSARCSVSGVPGLQLASALTLMPVLGPTEQLLARLAPGTEAEALARPRYLYDRALADAATALELAERDEARLLARLPATLDSLREDRQPSPARRAC